MAPDLKGDLAAQRVLAGFLELRELVLQRSRFPGIGGGEMAPAVHRCGIDGAAAAAKTATARHGKSSHAMRETTRVAEKRCGGLQPCVRHRVHRVGCLYAAA